MKLIYFMVIPGPWWPAFAIHLVYVKFKFSCRCRFKARWVLLNCPKSNLYLNWIERINYSIECHEYYAFLGSRYKCYDRCLHKINELYWLAISVLYSRCTKYNFAMFTQFISWSFVIRNGRVKAWRSGRRSNTAYGFPIRTLLVPYYFDGKFDFDHFSYL